MAKYFIDTNFFMRSYEGLFLDSLSKIANHELYISALTVHITCYVHAISLPNTAFTEHLSYFTLLPMTNSAVVASLAGPTPDYEDNLQLVTAAQNHIPVFVTLDKKLLKLQKHLNTAIISPEML